MVEPLTREDFLDKKRDYSPFLVHLTRADESCSAKEVLDTIINEKTLRAYNYFCIFKDRIAELEESLRSKFNVVCFTETPMDQIEILLKPVYGKNVTLESYGLVFKKKYIREKDGNPALYVTGDLSLPLWRLYEEAKAGGFSSDDNKLLALVNKCDETVDFHWEREWRIVGNLEFDLNDIYCGLCPEDDIPHFEDKYPEVKFISPCWGINKILDKLVMK